MPRLVYKLIYIYIYIYIYITEEREIYLRERAISGLLDDVDNSKQ